MGTINFKNPKYSEDKPADVQLVKIVSYPQSKKHYIMGTSANLLGICFILITGLRINNLHVKTYADEICLLSSFLFLSSCLLSYLAMRNESSHLQFESCADWCFIIGIISLFLAMCTIIAGW